MRGNPGAWMLWLGLLAGGPAAACTGRVVLDRNGDGRADAGDPGISGVSVSDGRQWARSDAQGRYRLVPEPARPLFLIKPAGFRLGTDAQAQPRFWRADCGDFLLQADAAKGEGLDVLVMGDPQPKHATDLDYYRRDIIEPLFATSGGKPVADLGLTLGDLVNDRMDLLAAVGQQTARLGTPWLYVPGNHDADPGSASDAESLRSYAAIYGPDSYAWEEAQANFIVLDDVVVTPDGPAPGYVGGLREDQFEFLAAYLRGADRSRLLVLAVHIPLFDTAPELGSFRPQDRRRLFALLRDFPKVLVLSAHGHIQRHYFHGVSDGWNGRQPLHEYNVGAASGAFWTGVRDAEGIPDTTMFDGSPNGVARLRIAADGSYALRWQVARDAALDGGIALHAPKVLRRGAWPGFAVYANVFMGHAGNTVEYRIDAGPWRAMMQVVAPDPRVLAENAADDAAEQLRGYDRAPEPWDSTHLWRGSLPTELAPGPHRIEVRAIDDWRGELRAETNYRLDDIALPAAQGATSAKDSTRR